eukprot:TRINITY_DN9059_c0_g2_i1.p1 TRINITY_DN9059_c0_g2~~TRINITY_DN9059_c0_g2_i1.p1  ORF type:complete len:300 (-),score=15.94 TRINITY_DN9059_c0_g2_i1:389-1288(-)
MTFPQSLNYFPGPTFSVLSSVVRRNVQTTCKASRDSSHLDSSSPISPGSSASALQTAGSLLQTACAHWPLRASLTSGTLLCLSDLLAQSIEQWQRKPEKNHSHRQSILSSQTDKSLQGSLPCVQDNSASNASPILNLNPGPHSKPNSTSTCNYEDNTKPSLESFLSVLEQIDFLRTVRLSAYGFFIYGPVLHVWFRGMDRIFPTPSLRSTLSKVAMSQTMLNPALLAFVFAYNYAWMGRLEELPEKYRRDLLPAMQTGWRFWIPASITNFGLVPLPFRVLFSSSCSLVWNCYVSMASTK